MNLKGKIKRLIPNYLYNIYRRYNIKKTRNFNGRRRVEEVFTEIYNKGLWGENESIFHSGSGSTDELANKYSDEVKKIIDERNIRTVIDLGCGNFNVGKRIINNKLDYIGIDIVEQLIIFNNEKYAKENIRFLCKNIIEDELPDADLCIIRQVLQHLSNEQITTILKKIRKYKFVLITEHYPSTKIKKITPNKDKPHGPDVRIYDNSAVYLDRDPFNLNNLRLVSEVKLTDCLVKEGELLKTYLVENE